MVLSLLHCYLIEFLYTSKYLPTMSFNITYKDMERGTGIYLYIPVQYKEAAFCFIA